MHQTTENIFTSNLELLKNNHPRVWDIVDKYIPQFKTELVFSKNKLPNIKINDDLFLHDQTDPYKEGEEFLKVIPEQSNGVVIFHGMGLGYGPLTVLKSRTDIRFIIIFELVPEFFIHALQNLDLSILLNDKRVILSIGKDPDVAATLAPVTRTIKLEDTSLLHHTPSFQYRNNEYINLSEKVYTYANEQNISANTFKAHGKDFISNRLSFLSMLNKTSLIDSLAGKFENIPAILVASGPSLSKNIETLKKFKNKAVIIAVDSALPALLNNDIEPDFITAIDYRDITYEKISPCAAKIKNASLICSSWVCKDIPKIFPAKNVFWTYTSSPMEKWLNTSLGGKFASPGAGTVAHLNLIAAIIMKCSPIVFVGQDLSFSPNDTEDDHVEGTVIRNNNDFNDLIKKNDGLVWVKANKGKDLPTMRAYYGFIKHFENLIQNNQNHYINATEGGAFIEGTEIDTLKNVFNRFCSKEKNIENALKEINSSKKLTDLSKLIKEVNFALRLTNKVEKLIQKSDKTIHSAKAKISELENHSIYQNLKSLPKNLVKNLGDIDDINNEIDNEHQLWQFFDEATMEELMQTDRMKYEIERIQNDKSKYIEWLDKSFNRINEINRIRKELLLNFQNILKDFISHNIKEKQFLKKIAQNNTTSSILGLIKIYMKSGDFIFAKPYLEKLISEDDNLEAYFYLGQIYALHDDFEKADLYFDKVNDSNESQFIEKIDAFKLSMGDKYFDYAVFSHNFSIDTERSMIQKGLRFCESHEKLAELTNFALLADAEKINKKENKPEKVIENWMTFFKLVPGILNRIDTHSLEKLYLAAGKFYQESKENLNAMTFFNKAIAVNCEFIEPRLHLSDILYEMGHDSLADEYLNKAIEIDKNFVKEYQNIKNQKVSRETENLILKGNSLFSKNLYQEAADCFSEILKTNPNHCEALHNLGVTFKTMGNRQKAIEYYQKAVNSNPEYFLAYYNLGVAFHEMGEYDQAVKYFKRTIDIEPNHSSSLLNMGNALKALNRTDEAEFYFKHSLEINPNLAAPLNNLGVIYQEKGDIEKAIDCFKKFLEREPNNPEALKNLMDELQYACEWNEIDFYIKKAWDISSENNLNAPAIKPFQSLRLVDDPDFHLMVVKSIVPPKDQNAFRHSPRKRDKDKIHIGYISSDFKDHPIGHLFSDFMRLHNRKNFKISCYSTTENHKNKYAEIIIKNSDEFHDIKNLNFQTAAEKIYNDKVDILVDLTGHTSGSNFKILAYKPAPVQVSYLGFLGASGADYMDYILCDEIVVPEKKASSYSEEPAYLPTCYQVTDYSHIGKGKNFSREDFKLPEKSIVFCSFNQPYKYNPELFGTWMKILKRVKNSVLWLRDTNPLAKENIYNFAKKQNIHRDKIIFSTNVQLQDHLERLKLADIALDPVVYNGGATTNNALYAGIPVITKQGNSFVTRMSSSSLNALGMPELITASLNEYEELAVKLGNEPALLKAVKSKIEVQKINSDLFNLEKFTRDLEKLYKNMFLKLRC